jgi:hypothetical protein
MSTPALPVNVRLVCKIYMRELLLDINLTDQQWQIKSFVTVTPAVAAIKLSIRPEERQNNQKFLLLAIFPTLDL